MNLGDDLHKVWEIKTLKRKPKEEEARKFLDRIAKQVQPIMRKHKWRVELLSEFCRLSHLGWNAGAGIHVKLRLRSFDRDEDFLPFDEVLDTMLHELCHNEIGPHNASFHKLWDQLRKECEELINKGISRSEQRFHLPRSHLGGISSKPHSSLRQVSLAAAQNRAKRIGGDSSIMAAQEHFTFIDLTETMAAETRFYDLTGEEDVIPLKSRKRSRSANGEQESTFIDLTETIPKNCRKGYGEASWQCSACTLLNPPLAPVCTLCETQKPKGVDLKTAIWSCRFCTSENDVKVDKCDVCGS